MLKGYSIATNADKELVMNFDGKDEYPEGIVTWSNSVAIPYDKITQFVIDIQNAENKIKYPSPFIVSRSLT